MVCKVVTMDRVELARSVADLRYVLEAVKALDEAVTKDNWLGGHTYGDSFSISTTDDTVTARRSDANGGWGMNLQFVCTYPGMPAPV